MNRVHREGRVVERHGGDVVRFDTGCGAECACNPGRRSPELTLDALDARVGSVRPGTRLSVSVSERGLTWLAATLFALPLAALVAAALVGTRVGPALGIDADLAAALLGLSAAGLTLAVAVRHPGALVRGLEVTAHVHRTDS